MFAKNVGGIDRVLRIGVGAALLLATAAGLVGMWGLIGIVPLATGLASTCPVYSVLGLKTCPVSKAA